MPKILERFTSGTAQQELGGRRAQAGDFGADTGAILQDMSHTVQRAGREHIERKEEEDARGAMVDIAKSRAKFSERADKALTSEEDLGKIKEEFENDLAEIRNRRTTTKGLAISDQHGAVSTNTFREQIRQVEARRYGASLAKDGKDHAASMAAIVQRNPELLPYAIESSRALYATYEGRVPPDVLQHAKQQQEEALWRAGANAAIEVNPRRALEQLQNNGFEGLRPDDRAALVNRAQVEIKAAEVSVKQAEYETKKKQEEADNLHLGKMLTDWGNGKPWDPKAIARMEEVSPKMRKGMIDVIADLTRDKKDKPNHEALDATYTRIHLPEGSENRIDTQGQLNELLFNKTISPKEHNALSAELNAREKPGQRAVARFVSDSKRQITGMDNFGQAPANGWSAYRAFSAHVNEEITRAREAGESITPLITPGNPRYLGNLVDAYTQTARQRVAASAEEIRQNATTLAEGVGAGVAPPKGASAPPASTETKPKPQAQAQGFNVYGRRTDLPGQPWIYWVKDAAEFEKLPPGAIGRMRDGTEKVRP